MRAPVLWHSRIVLAILIALVAASSSASCIVRNKECTSVGCHSGIALAPRSVIFDSSTPEHLEVTACRNGSCVTSSLVRNERAPGKALFCVSDSSAAAYVQCTLLPSVVDAGRGQHELSAELFVRDVDGLRDGDVVSFTVTNRTDPDARVTTGDVRVTYETQRPNGPDCEPVCRRATL